MTAAERRRVIAAAEYEAQRRLAQAVVCPSCKAAIDRPCRNRAREPLPMEHPARIRKAEEFRARGEVECDIHQCRQVPAGQVLVLCGSCRRIAKEIQEANEMADRMDAAQWDGHWQRLYDRQIGKGRTAGVAQARATVQTTELFGPRPEEAA